jgi:SAM-dependent methyltransferase
MAQRTTAAVYVAARLGIADLIAQGVTTTAAIARRTGADRRSLARLLRALVTIGVCREVGRDRFELTAVGAHLAENANPSLKPYALFEGEMLWRSWGGLIDSIRTGQTETELAGAGNRFERMGQSREAVATFNEAMASMTRLAIPGILAAYDFSKIRRLIDVGGGFGVLLAAILAEYPAMRGAVFDLPRCAEGAMMTLSEHGVGDRAEFIAGDFFKSVPAGADALIVKNIIHDWDDRRGLRILKNCRRALPAGGRLILVERLMPEALEASPEHRAVAFIDLNMLRGPGGAERTERQYRRLITASGFNRISVRPTGIMHVIEAIAAG